MSTRRDATFPRLSEWSSEPPPQKTGIEGCRGWLANRSVLDGLAGRRDMRMSRSLSGSPFGFARLVSLGLIALLVTPLVAPVAAQWEEDSWLVNIIGPERLALGDEIGCHGIPGKDIREQTEAIIECRDYLMERTNASKWGAHPLSFGPPDGDWTEDAQRAVKDAGFQAISGEIPEGQPHHTYYFQANGGSLEKSVGSVEEFQAALNSSATTINLYWRGRDHDVIVRPDSELVSAIESTNAWFTTWGEHSSYIIASNQFSVIDSGDGSLNVSSEYMGWFEFPNSWSVPVTNVIYNLSADVVRVVGEEGELTELSAEEPHLQEGWRQTEGELYLTLAAESNVTVSFDSSNVGNFSVATAPQFNGHEVAITVAGIHTYDLFYWSKRWDDTPMRFTWLVEPREVGAFNWWLPVVAAIVAIAAPIALYSVVKRDHRARGVVEVFDSLDQIQLEEE